MSWPHVGGSKAPYPNLLQFEQDPETARPAAGNTWEPGHSEEDTGQGATLQPSSVGTFSVLQYLYTQSF